MTLADPGVAPWMTPLVDAGILGVVVGVAGWVAILAYVWFTQRMPS
jgi:hypothetical protein